MRSLVTVSTSLHSDRHDALFCQSVKEKSFALLRPEHLHLNIRAVIATPEKSRPLWVCSVWVWTDDEFHYQFTVVNRDALYHSFERISGNRHVCYSKWVNIDALRWVTLSGQVPCNRIVKDCQP